MVTRVINHTTAPKMPFLSNLVKNSVEKFLKITPRLNQVRFITTKKEIEITVVRRNGATLKTKGKVGESFYDVIVDNNHSVDFEGYGLCEGNLLCTSCHIIFKKADYDRLKKRSEEEADLLETAFDVTDTSRLGCQVHLTEDMDGIVVEVPENVNDARLL